MCWREKEDYEKRLKVPIVWIRNKPQSSNIQSVCLHSDFFLFNSEQRVSKACQGTKSELTYIRKCICQQYTFFQLRQLLRLFQYFFEADVVVASRKSKSSQAESTWNSRNESLLSLVVHFSMITEKMNTILLEK